MSTSTRKSRTSYTDDFKKQIVQLYLSGKSKQEIAKEYNLNRASLDMWIKRYQNSGSFSLESNLTDKEKELKYLRKLSKQLLLENEILKQAALILGKK